MRAFAKNSFFLRKNSALHSVRGCYFQKSVLGIIESFTKTVVKRKIFQINHSEHPELFQKNVLGIIEGFTKWVSNAKKFRQTIVKWLRFQKSCPWDSKASYFCKTVYFPKKLSLVLCGQLFYRSSKNLATLTAIIYPLSRKATKIQ